MNINFFQQIGIVIIAYFILLLVIGIRGHKVKMRMKQFGNGAIFIGALVLFLYVLLFGIVLTPKVVAYTDTFLLEQDFSPDSALLVKGMPFAFIIMTFIVALGFIKRVFSYNPFKYNKEEKEFINGENTRIVLKIKQLFRIKETIKTEEKGKE